MIHHILYLLSLQSILTAVSAFYFPVATSGQVKKGVATAFRSVDRTGVSCDIVLARNSSGQPIAFRDFCPHRGMSFDGATVTTEDSVVCGYHGFSFDLGHSRGQLKQGLGVSGSCAQLSVVQTFELGGLVWVKPSESLFMPDFPPEEFDAAYRSVRGFTDICAPLENVIENVCDSLHLGFVHSFGNPENPEPYDYKAKRTSPIRGEASFQYLAGPTSLSKVFSRRSVVDVDNWFHLPSTVGTRVTAGSDVKVVCVHACRLSLTETRVFWCLYRNWLTWPCLDPLISWIMQFTLCEDKAVLEQCKHIRSSLHSRYDKLQRLYRRASDENSV